MMDAKKLRAFRHRLGLTQFELAAKIGMSRRAYSDVETGKAEFRQLHRMALEYVSLMEAIRQRNPSLAETSITAQCLSYVSLLD